MKFTQEEYDYIKRRTSKNYIFMQRILLSILILMFIYSSIFKIDIILYVAFIGFFIRKLFDTWNGDILYKILNTIQKNT